MKKLSLLLLATIFVANLANAQKLPAREFSLTVTDNAGGTKILKLGLDPIATNGIDTTFGESELPPFPPSGVFEARFIGDDIAIPLLGQGSYKDYRPGTSQHVGTHTHELRYQPGTGTGITISWNLPRGVTATLQDLLGGIVVNQTLTATGSYNVPNPGIINKLKLSMNYVLTSVKQGSNAIPAKYQLNPNFPNPFNPVTTIEFALPVPSNVTLKIFNAAGLEIQTLVNQKLPAGMHRMQWEAQAFPSGVYFFRLQAGKFAQTRRLILLK